MENTERSKQKKKVVMGRVVSDKMEKTVVVAVERTFRHKLLHKILRKTKTYKVHDEHNAAKTGDWVEVYEGRPISKTKYMYLARVVNDRIS